MLVEQADLQIQLGAVLAQRSELMLGTFATKLGRGFRAEFRPPCFGDRVAYFCRGSSRPMPI